MKDWTGAAVFIGGTAGSFLRLAATEWNTTTLPAGTFAVNIAGSFLLGLVTAVFFYTAGLSPAWKSGFGAGFCGGLTTMSTFASETVALAADSIFRALCYVAISVAGGIAAAAVGYFLASMIIRRILVYKGESP